MIKKLIKSVPYIEKLIRSLTHNGFKGSATYWEERYAKGGTSGSGSYGQLAQFKAQILNDFVLEHKVKSVIEFGCGDGNQLRLSKYTHYVGLDVSKKAIEICRQKFNGDTSKEFFLYPSEAKLAKLDKVDLTLSLDVIYHLVEDRVYESYMYDLFRNSNKFVIIYASDWQGALHYHERPRNFTSWISAHVPHWELVLNIPNKFPYNPLDPDNTSQSDFFIYKKTLNTV